MFQTSLGLDIPYVTAGFLSPVHVALQRLIYLYLQIQIV